MNGSIFSQQSRRLVIAAIAFALPGVASAENCDRECLEGFAERYMDALVAQEPARLSWGEVVRFTENNIPMRIGDGAWATVNDAQEDPLIAADPESGTVTWFGWITEHDAPAYYGMRLTVRKGTITEVETVAARKENSEDFGTPESYDPDPAFETAVPAKDRDSRERLIDIVDGYYSTLQQNDGTLFTQFADDCHRYENGFDMTHGSSGPGAIAEGCEAQMELGLYNPVTYVSHRRFPLVDPQRGIVVAFAHRDYAAHSKTFTTTDGKEREMDGLTYPWTFAVIEVFKIEAGRISNIETISTLLPYRMPSHWEETGPRLSGEER